MKKYVKHQPESPSCIYNHGVVCRPEDRACEKCGWNPEVEKKRKENAG